MLSSLAHAVGLGSPVPEKQLRLLAVLMFWAPGKANGVNRTKAEANLGACLGIVTKKSHFFRFQSTWKQPEHICHRWATDAHACQLNSQQFFCWLFFLEDAAPDLAVTVSASLEKLGIVDKAVVQCGRLVTTMEGSMNSCSIVPAHTLTRLFTSQGGEWRGLSELKSLNDL